MPVKLSPEERVALKTLKQRGQSNLEIARVLGVTEGAVRYRLRREASQAEDRRQNKPHKADPLADVIDHFIRDGRPLLSDGDRNPSINVRALHDYLVGEYQYQGSYRSVLRFVRARYPAPKLRPFRRVETPPGAQAQVDWGEFSGLDVGAGRRPCTPSSWCCRIHARRSSSGVGAWTSSPGTTPTTRRSAASAASRRCCGSTTSRPASAHGAGPWGQINAAYRSYARGVGFHVDACLPRCPEDKGKVENKVGVLRRRLRLRGPFRRPGGAAGGQRRPTRPLGSAADLPGHGPQRAGELAGGTCLDCGRCRCCRRPSTWR